jgi:hypothetical protein
MEHACQNAGDKCPTDGKDLSWLFSELLNRGGALQVTGTWTYDAAAKQVQLTLDQTQPTGLYRMPIEVRITAMRPAGAPPPNAAAAAASAGRGGGAPIVSQPTTQIVQLMQQHQVFSLPSETEPSLVELDPNAWVMMRATLEKK